MLVLIGGESHVGKTLLAQRLLERYRMPYTSLDHIKMALYRGWRGCPFTPLDDDAAISTHLWGVVQGMIDTCRENRQNLVLEGCYLPPERVQSLRGEDIAALYLVFSEHYIRRNFEKICAHENVIEKRKAPWKNEQGAYIHQNAALRARCRAAGVACFEIDTDYDTDMQAVYRYLHSKIVRLRPYTPADLEGILRLFEQTVRSVCARDYTPAQIEAWVNLPMDRGAWNESLLSHDTVVAEIGGKLVGFGDRSGDYLDRLYVHHKYQGVGIAASIVQRLEDNAAAQGETRMITHASVGARAFFERHGYRLVRVQQVLRDGQTLTNFEMGKQLI